jgi:hypothetical protein
LLVQDRRRIRDLKFPGGQREVAALFELLEVHRIVDIRDEDLAARSKALEMTHGVTLEDDHVRPLLETAEGPIQARAHLMDRKWTLDELQL